MSKRAQITAFGMILLTLALGNLVGANAYRQSGWGAAIGVAGITGGIGLLIIAFGATR